MQSVSHDDVSRPTQPTFRPEKKVGQKLTVARRNIDKDAPKLLGRFLGSRDQELTDKNSGELKTVPALYFELADHTRVCVLANSGLMSALRDAFVEPNDVIEISWLGKVDLDGGRTVNQYDIYAAELPPAPAKAAKK